MPDEAEIAQSLAVLGALGLGAAVIFTAAGSAGASLNPNLQAQWNRIQIIDAIDGTVLSDHMKVLNVRYGFEFAGLKHDLATIILNHPQSYNPYSDVLIELVVAVDNPKCNVVVVDKGDDSIIVKFDGKTVAITERIVQSDIYFIEDRNPLLFSKWLSFNFNKKEETSGIVISAMGVMAPT